MADEAFDYEDVTVYTLESEDERKTSEASK